MSAPIQELGWPTRIFLAVIGSAMGVMSVTFPLTNLLHAFGILDEKPPWGLGWGVVLMVFCGAAAVEFFTGHGTKYFGELVRALAEKITGKASGD